MYHQTRGRDAEISRDGWVLPSAAVRHSRGGRRLSAVLEVCALSTCSPFLCNNTTWWLLLSLPHFAKEETETADGVTPGSCSC